MRAADKDLRTKLVEITPSKASLESVRVEHAEKAKKHKKLTFENKH